MPAAAADSMDAVESAYVAALRRTSQRPHLPRIEASLLLVRCMRQAVIWQGNYRVRHDEGRFQTLVAGATRRGGKGATRQRERTAPMFFPVERS